MLVWKRIAPPLAVAALAAAALAAAPPASPEDTSGLEYVSYFEPFTGNPLFRLQNTPTMPAPTPLFRPFDPLDGLDPHTATSRLVVPTRAVFSMPVVDAKVGDEVRIPLYQESGPPLTAEVLWLVFDPAVLQAVDARAEGWKGSAVEINASPEGITPERRFNLTQYAGEPYAGKGALASVRFRVVGPGASPIEVDHFDTSDNEFNNVRAVVRNGLVRATK